MKTCFKLWFTTTGTSLGLWSSWPRGVWPPLRQASLIFLYWRWQPYVSAMCQIFLLQVRAIMNNNNTNKNIISVGGMLLLPVFKTWEPCILFLLRTYSRITMVSAILFTVFIFLLRFTFRCVSSKYFRRSPQRKFFFQNGS